MPNNQNEITPIGFANFRNKKIKFGIKLDDRRRHIYTIGKTGVGKSTLLENMVIADIRAGRGVGVIDPHGELAERIVEFIPEERLDDVVYFNPADLDYPIAFNPMEQVGTEFRHLVASGLMGVFKKIFVDVWSARMAYILNNTLLALLEYPGSTILGVMRMYSDKNYRKKIVSNLKDPVVKGFWEGEFANYGQRLESEAVAAIQNKVGQFVSNPLIRNILGQPNSTINMREIMDSGKIFIANLSKGKIGEDNSALLGAMIITRLQLSAMSRVDITDESKRKDFFLYVDEFQNFATDSFANILSEARKYRLSLILAHQYIGQLVSGDNNTKVRDAVFGNVGSIFAFRVGAADADFLENEFMPEFLPNDLVNLAKHNIYAKLMIDGVSSRPFSAETLPPQKSPLISYRDVIIQNSREHYGTPRKVVDAKIASEWDGTSEDIVQERMDRQTERSPRDILRNPPAERREGDRRHSPMPMDDRRQPARNFPDRRQFDVRPPNAIVRPNIPQQRQEHFPPSVVQPQRRFDQASAAPRASMSTPPSAPSHASPGNAIRIQPNSAQNAPRDIPQQAAPGISLRVQSDTPPRVPTGTSPQMPQGAPVHHPQAHTPAPAMPMHHVSNMPQRPMAPSPEEEYEETILETPPNPVLKSLDERLKQGAPRVPQPRPQQHAKPNINIDDLRKAISESLNEKK